MSLLPRCVNIFIYIYIIHLSGCSKQFGLIEVLLIWNICSLNGNTFVDVSVYVRTLGISDIQ